MTTQEYLDSVLEDQRLDPDSDERKALTCGCDAYLAKPILLRDFLNLVEKFIGGAAPAR